MGAPIHPCGRDWRTEKQNKESKMKINLFSSFCLSRCHRPDQQRWSLWLRLYRGNIVLNFSFFRAYKPTSKRLPNCRPNPHRKFIPMNFIDAAWAIWIIKSMIFSSNQTANLNIIMSATGNGAAPCATAAAPTYRSWWRYKSNEPWTTKQWREITPLWIKCDAVAAAATTGPQP